MELFREEYEAKLPRKWGKEIYKRLEKGKKDSSKTLAPKPHIHEALKLVPTKEGPVDVTPYFDKFNQDELCDFLSRMPHCRNLIMKNWRELDDKVFRCVSMYMGSSLEEVDFSGSAIEAQNLEILLANCSQLKVIRISGCSKVEAQAMLWFTRAGSHTVRELYADNCVRFKSEPLLAICGEIGLSPPKMSHIRVLDLHDSPVEDVGLISVAKCCKHLRFLNLSGCTAITDKSFVPLAQASTHFEVVNLSGLHNLSNKSVLALAHHCPQITSLNLKGLCKVSDKPIIALSHKCLSLQALNLASLRKLTEHTLAEICLHTPGILCVNMTGCDAISLKGLEAAAKGLKYVEIAQTFFGLKPVDNHVEKKLSHNMELVIEVAANRIQNMGKNALIKADMAKEFAILRRDKSARVLQGAFTRYMARQFFYNIYRRKYIDHHATTIQRVYRGGMGRLRALSQKNDMKYFWASAPRALLIQRCFRGHKVRRRRFDVATALRHMYVQRKYEAEVALAVRFQAGGRKYLTRQRINAMFELTMRRGLDEYNAMVTLQCFSRQYLARMRVLKIMIAKARYHEVRNAAATRLQHFWKASMGQFKAKQSRAEHKMAAKKRLKACCFVQRFYRGHLGRQRVRRRLIRNAAKFWAATQVQRIWRGSRIMYWRDMRMNTIAAYVLDRQYLERRERIASSRLRYKNFLIDNRKDSASDHDQEDHDKPHDDWEERWDAVSRRKYWFSKALNQATYDEPKDEHAHQENMLYHRVRVYWIVQQIWYEGTVTRYNRRKHRHKIEYDDGDTEWINFDEERDRVQVQQSDGSWVMYIIFHPPALRDEMRKGNEKAERDAFKKQAHEDATQWDIIHDPKDEEVVMFISNKTGEIRAGAPNAKHWIVEDDGHGFPRFFNTINQDVVYEDPRFVESVTIDQQAQRDFVMQELRYATYFCKELWTKYSDVLKEKAGTHRDRKLRFVANMIRKSDKPRHLVAFLVRAKNLYKTNSVVDAPIDPGAVQEIEYAQWLSERFAELIEWASHAARDNRDSKLKLVQKLKAKGEKKVYCAFCKRETRRHLDFCPTCGKQQVDLIQEGSPEDPTLAIKEADDEGTVEGSIHSQNSQEKAKLALFGDDNDDDDDEENEANEDEDDNNDVMNKEGITGEDENEEDDDMINDDNDNDDDLAGEIDLEDSQHEDDSNEEPKRRVTFGPDQIDEVFDQPGSVFMDDAGNGDGDVENEDDDDGEGENENENENEEGDADIDAIEVDEDEEEGDNEDDD
jgi:hypothetical protein